MIEKVVTKTIKGDLIKLALNGDFDVIVHGCNCFCTMGGGIAYQISKFFPEAKEVDMKTTYGSRDKLGEYTKAEVIKNNKKIIVVNAYTQYDYGRSKINVDYFAIRNVFRKIAKDFAGLRIAYPKIGAGLAGGNWDVIISIINEELNGQNHTYVEYDNKLEGAIYEDFRNNF